MNKKVIISSFLIGVLVCFAIMIIIPKDNINRTQIYERTSLNTSIKKIYNATVSIESYREGILLSSGSGFIYKKDNKYGYIITNEHVISDNATIKIILYDDKEIEAELLGKDEYLDLAVLRIDKKYVDLVATIGNSRNTLLGDSVFTVGSPLGKEYRGSVTQGIISGKDRMVKVSTIDDNDLMMRVIQIDASINHGNSGGPLLNINGEVIGIISLKLADEGIEGMSFAMPIEYAMNHISDLENGKEIKYPTLGIKVAEVNDASSLLSYDININTNINYGVVVLNINKDSGTTLSGLKKGDIITKVNGRKVLDKSYLKYELYQYKSNDIITLTYLRNNKEHSTKVVLK